MSSRKGFLQGSRLFCWQATRLFRVTQFGCFSAHFVLSALVSAALVSAALLIGQSAQAAERQGAEQDPPYVDDPVYGNPVDPWHELGARSPFDQKRNNEPAPWYRLYGAAPVERPVPENYDPTYRRPLTPKEKREQANADWYYEQMLGGGVSNPFDPWVEAGVPSPVETRSKNRIKEKNRGNGHDGKGEPPEAAAPIGEGGDGTRRESKKEGDPPGDGTRQDGKREEDRPLVNRRPQKGKSDGVPKDESRQDEGGARDTKKKAAGGGGHPEAKPAQPTTYFAFGLPKGAIERMRSEPTSTATQRRKGRIGTILKKFTDDLLRTPRVASQLPGKVGETVGRTAESLQRWWHTRGFRGMQPVHIPRVQVRQPLRQLRHSKPPQIGK